MATLAIQSNDNEPLIRQTWGAASINVTPAATPGLIWEMRGAAGRVIRIKSLSLYRVAIGNGVMYTALKRYSAVATGGTAVVVTPQPHDTLDVLSADAQPQIRHFTANPTAGTLVGTIHGAAVGFALGGSLGVGNWSMGWSNDKALVLRGTSDVIGLDMLGGAVPAGGVYTVDVEYTNELSGNSFDAQATA